MDTGMVAPANGKLSPILSLYTEKKYIFEFVERRCFEHIGRDSKFNKNI